MSEFSSSGSFPARQIEIGDYITSKKSKPSKSGKHSTQLPPAEEAHQSYPFTESRDPARSDTLHKVNTLAPVTSEGGGPYIVRSAHQVHLEVTSGPPGLYLIHPEAHRPIRLPPWVASFRPRIPPLNPDSRWESPIPKYDNVQHAVLIRNALTKFHLAVLLADEDAGESTRKLKQNLEQVCKQYMPSMVTLKIKKHQIVFFYHGRKQYRMGNDIWEAITEWEDKEWVPRECSRTERVWVETQDQKNVTAILRREHRSTRDCD